VRGFNLFAAFLGVAMIAIAAGYAIYTQQAKTQRMDTIMVETVRFDTAGVSATIKSDVYNTILLKIRQEFQDFFANAVITPPRWAWSSEDAFINWFETNFAQSDTLTEWIADRMMAELQSYTAVPVFGEEYEISVVGSRDSTAEALKSASYAKIMPDGTFVYVIDTTSMSPEMYQKLPKIVVRKRGDVSGATTDIVLPRGKWEIPVRLRILQAYRVARDAKEQMDGGDYKDLALAVGHCSTENLAVCDAFKIEGSRIEPLTRDRAEFERLSVSSRDDADVPANILSPCTYQYMDYITLLQRMNVPWTDFKEAMKRILQDELQILQGLREQAQDEETRKRIDEEIEKIQAALQDIDSDAAREELERGPCRGDYDIIFPLLNAVALGKSFALIPRLQSLHDEEGRPLVRDISNFRVSPDPGAYKRYETAKIVRRTAINLAEIVCEEVAGPLNFVLALLGLGDICGETAKKTSTSPTVISFDACKISGSVYCAAPTRYSYIVTWSDPSDRYRINPDVPATFHFRVVEGEVPYTATLKAVENIVKEITVTGTKNNADEEEVSKEILSNARRYLPGIIEGCVKQYTQVELRCRGNLPEKDVTYILTGYTPQNLEVCGTNCQPKDSLKEICQRLKEYNDTITIPGVYKHRNATDWAKIIAGSEDTVYCDKYIAPGSSVVDVLQKINNYFSGITEMAKAKLCPDTQNPSLDDIVKAGIFGPACWADNTAGASETEAIIGEYNYMYERYIRWEVEAARNGLGMCDSNDPQLQAFIQAFSPPRKEKSGDVEIVTGGSCHPQHVFDQAVSIARMRLNSIKCNVSPPQAKQYVLLETTWMHIGSEIYASCNPAG